MNKKVWVKAVPWDKSIVTTALENGADAVYVDKGDVEKVKSLGRIQTVAEGAGDLKIGQDVVEWEIKGKADEEAIICQAKEKIVIVQTTDWTIIPLENLIAQTNGLIAQSGNLDEAKTALSILEKGVDGILTTTRDWQEVKRIIKFVKGGHQQIPLQKAVIKQVKILGMGDRVCVDTCTNMVPGQGMLIGNSSAALFLVHSESLPNPYVEPRPFRVNAGPVHAYIKIAGNRTKYLSELKSGDEVLIVDYRGETEIGAVGRVKTEKRPLLLIEAELESRIISTILQNAETIRLTKPDGSSVSVVNLKSGDEVLCSVETAGRHFGMKIDETISEK
ncbi:3-dehydroquinate synthase II [bacterium]|nr:3-dehydroquinate synthase II [bacterium]